MSSGGLSSDRKGDYMKKTAAALAALALMFALTACGRTENQKTTAAQTRETIQKETTQETKEKATKQKETTEKETAEKKTEATKPAGNETGESFGEEPQQTQSGSGLTDGMSEADPLQSGDPGVDVSTTDDRGNSEGVLDRIGDDIRDDLTR